MKRSTSIMALVFILLVCLLSVKNGPMTINAIREGCAKEEGLAGIASTVRDAYLKSDVYKKNEFIDINGLYARMTGRGVVNHIARMTNGMLGAESVTAVDPTKQAVAVHALSQWLSAQEIPFLYVQMPYKCDLQNKMIPIGVTNASNKNADMLLQQIEALGISTLDLRPGLTDTPELVEQYFYVTDHHWNALGAFMGYQATAKKLQDFFPDQEIVSLEALQLDAWEIHTLENQFLGSEGRRVGKGYAGLDDLIWMTPKFETQMSCSVPKSRFWQSGSFSEALIRDMYLQDVADVDVGGKQGTHYNLNHYCVYIGGDYPLVQHRNPMAPVDKKLVILKDSFSLPYQAFLSTIFTEIDVLDPRYGMSLSVAEYIHLADPDLVIMAFNPGMITEKKAFSYGLETMEIRDEEILLAEVCLEIGARNHSYSFTTVEQPLEPGALYHISVGNIRMNLGESDGVCFALYDSATKKVLDSWFYDFACSDEKDWYFRTPETLSETANVIIYSGIPGACEGVGLTVEDLQIYIMQ